MFSDHPFHLLRSAAVVVLLGAASTAFAGSSTNRQPLILDTQGGISDGQGGTVLQTAPLSHSRIVEAQPIAAPEELTPNGAPPYIVAPYIQVPGATQTPYPTPTPPLRPRPVPHSQ
ncbi:hypothetical protein G3N95_17330 [Paraburkholderia sp. Tr-20389]|uniref:hypothetical protein n=1 Tax=Paraburkholderia sp. Tr-20389 TaxID=2703903 RepID=UPI00197EB291|nr:hypothetical protein [Paraburkholderia sp. Tr-20389]MBN3754714.1 hypothetical protein [Paraburkholderia sp. Tr-20389]